MSRTSIVARQEFAGYWEYLIDDALFTAPAHPLWGGAGLVDAEGRLIGIGSLLVQQMTAAGEMRDANMVVPIDLLPPILGDLTAHGHVRRPPRPWLGMFSAENDGHVVVASLADNGPAAEAGIEAGRHRRRRRRREGRQPRRSLPPGLERRAGRCRNPAPARARSAQLCRPRPQRRPDRLPEEADAQLSRHAAAADCTAPITCTAGVALETPIYTMCEWPRGSGSGIEWPEPIAAGRRRGTHGAESAVYRLNEPKVVSETLDGETIVVDLETGSYFSLNASASLIWVLVVDGYQQGAIGVGVARSFGLAAAEATEAVDRFLASLVADGLLVVPAEGPGRAGQPPAVADAWTGLPFEPPAIARFDDMQEMLLGIRSMTSRSPAGRIFRSVDRLQEPSVISVVVPWSCNGAHFVAEAIDSILAQPVAQPHRG